jgi:hypothetical protein
MLPDLPSQVPITPIPIDYPAIVSVLSSGFAQITNTIQQNLEKTDKTLKDVRHTQCEMQHQLQNTLQATRLPVQLVSLQPAGGSSRQQQSTAYGSTSRHVPCLPRNHPNWNKFLVSYIPDCLDLSLTSSLECSLGTSEVPVEDHNPR